MTVLDRILRKIGEGLYEFSEHAVSQMIVRHIDLVEFHESLKTGEIIEDYPDDKYGLSCLILGFTNHERPIHIHCSYASRPLLKIVTVYEPDPQRWLESRRRRRIDGQ